jgi:hypothetical protein
MDPMANTIPAVPLRAPETVMRLARLGSAHQCRLSFMRVLLRRMQREGWSFDRPVFDIDESGVGVAVYAAHGPARSYSLVAFAHDLPPEQRSDRVIAHAWDSTFALFDGVPTAGDIARLSLNVPKQEAGRVSGSELSVSRANRSVRMFEHVVARLAAGRQPDAETVERVGYLMRTTAVYGSGKLGAADREVWAGRPEFRGAFQPEMLSVYLIRAYTVDLVEHLARARAPATAVGIDPALRRRLGVGNSTGLGLAPFIINHPALFHSWIAARETALARVRAVPAAAAEEAATFRNMLARARRNAGEWRSEHPVQVAKLAALKADLDRLAACVADGALAGAQPWDRLYRWAEEALSLEGQEQLVALMLEPYGALVDDLAASMGADEGLGFAIDGAMPLGRLREIVEEVYGFALEIDWDTRDANARVWYVSEEKLEPRLGERFEEPLEPYEQPLATGRDAMRMRDDIRAWQGADSVAAFLLRHPEHRHIARRAQTAARLPYAEIRDNTISAALMPIDLLRIKLAFFGATHFDPRSDRWLRINMYRDAPFPDELAASPVDDWSYPPLPQDRP